MPEKSHNVKEFIIRDCFIFTGKTLVRAVHIKCEQLFGNTNSLLLLLALFPGQGHGRLMVIIQQINGKKKP